MESGYIVLLILVWVLIAGIVGAMGEERKIGMAGAFFASLLLSPIIGLLFVIASDKIIKPQPPIKKNLKFNPNLYGQREMLRVEELINRSLNYAKQKDYAEAISNTNAALEICPNYPKALYNLSCFYSLAQMSTNSIVSLRDALLSGYNNFEIIKTDPDLEFLRTQDEYKSLESSNFIVTVEEKSAPKHVQDKYEALEKIGKLKDSGILTQEEFEKEKASILSQTN